MSCNASRGLPSEGRRLWKGLQTRRAERRTLCCSYLHRTCCGYPRKLLRKSLAVTLGSSNLPSTQTGQTRMLLSSFPCLLRSEIPAEVFLKPFLHRVLSLPRRQQEVILPSPGSHQPSSAASGVGVLWGQGADLPCMSRGDSPPTSPELAPNPRPRGAVSPQPNQAKSER